MASFSVVVVFRRDVQCEENGDDEYLSIVDFFAKSVMSLF